MISYQSRVKILDHAVHHGGKRSADPAIILWHSTEGDSALSSIEYLNTTNDKSASYHYVIDRDGTIYRMTPVETIAYHAGDSAWPHPIHATPQNPNKPNGGHSINPISIGIAFAAYDNPPTLEQRASGLWLGKVYMARYSIQPSLNLAHREVSPGRKSDPAGLVMDDWRKQLAEMMSR